MYWKFLELVVASLHQFRCFLAAVRTGSFTAAATELDMAQQSVSEQVRLLERACGVALFIRVGRGLRPTEAAHALTPHAQRAIVAGEQAVAAGRAVRDLLTGTVRLGVFGTMRYYVGADLVASILTRYPELRGEIVGQTPAATIELVRSGDVEAGIVALPVDDAQLSVRPLFRDEILYVTAGPTRAASPVTDAPRSRARHRPPAGRCRSTAGHAALPRRDPPRHRQPNAGRQPSHRRATRQSTAGPAIRLMGRSRQHPSPDRRTGTGRRLTAAASRRRWRR